MKKLVMITLAAALVASLSACAVPANTKYPKADEILRNGGQGA